MTSLLTIEAALRQAYRLSPEDADSRWLVEHGRHWQPGPWPKNLAIPAHCEFPMGRCFDNAARVLRSHAGLGLRYCEGVAAGHLGPVGEWHGWLVTEQGTVVDPTWFRSSGVPAQMTYFGATFPRSEIEAAAGDLRNGMISLRVGGRRGGARLSLLPHRVVLWPAARSLRAGS